MAKQLREICYSTIRWKGSRMLRFLTAGESHGKSLIGVLEGLPAGLPVDPGFIDMQLRRRQMGYGRGARMAIERDQIEIISGIRQGRTLGSPIAFSIRNRDWERWQIPMSIEPSAENADIRTVGRPRPGHADLAGALKFQTHDARNVLERASARETATRVAGGALCRLFLAHFGIRVGSHVVAIGKERISRSFENSSSDAIFSLDPESPMRCADPHAEKGMKELIDQAKAAGDSLGGVVETVASPIPPGLGSHIQWDRRLDSRIAQAMMSIPSAKAVEIGDGIANAQSPGSSVHDEIFYDSQAKRFSHKTNRAGGIEGGISNGADIRVRVYLKPIPTLSKPLGSVDLRSKQTCEAAVERSDTCVVPAAGVIAEAMLAYVLASSFLEKFGGDSIKEIEGNYAHFMRLLDEY
jgi:chorismate synthase